MKLLDYVATIRKTHFASKLTEDQILAFAHVIRTVITPSGYVYSILNSLKYLVRGGYHTGADIDINDPIAVNLDFQTQFDKIISASNGRHAKIYVLLKDADLSTLGSTNYMEYVCKMPIHEILDLFVKKDKQWEKFYKVLFRHTQRDHYKFHDYTKLKIFFDKVITISLAACFAMCDTVDICIIKKYCFDYKLSRHVRQSDTVDDIYAQMVRFPRVKAKQYIIDNLRTYVELFPKQQSATEYAQHNKMNLDVAIMFDLKFINRIPMLNVGIPLIDSFVGLKLFESESEEIQIAPTENEKSDNQIIIEI
jgi:hypothetical protein